VQSLNRRKYGIPETGITKNINILQKNGFKLQRKLEMVVSFIIVIYELPVTVAARSEAWVLGDWLLGSSVQILLKAWMFVRLFLCCVVLCR
jgi:hypothetical protein